MRMTNGRCTASVKVIGQHMTTLRVSSLMELPDGAELFLSSETTVNEAFGIGDSVLCVQGHPERGDVMTKKLLELRISRGQLTEEKAAMMIASLGTKTQEDGRAWTSLCKRFLKTPEESRRLHSS